MARRTRRDVLKTLGAAAAAAPLPAFAQAPPLAGAEVELLQSVAEVVLPSTLGQAGRRDVVSGFLRWLRNYKEGAETDHGYGFTRIRGTGPSPAARYPAQIAALERDAAARGGRFNTLPLDTRRTIVESAIAGAKVERLPGRPSGAHIVTDLMGFYFNSAAAFDLCYRAKIERTACRGLPGSDREPEAL
jgi:hypothetical protein